MHRMPGQNYQDLIVWQCTMDLVTAIYTATKEFPREELYGLTSQLRRAAVSIPSNIAEGQGRGADAELVRFLRIAHGSLREAETQILIAERLAYLTNEKVSQIMKIASEVGRMLNGLIRSKTSLDS
jgi:four helix bundle protein